jgi:hypothetical protein
MGFHSFFNCALLEFKAVTQASFAFWACLLFDQLLPVFYYFQKGHYPKRACLGISNVTFGKGFETW